MFPMHLLKYKDLCNLVEKITELKKYMCFLWREHLKGNEIPLPETSP